MTYRDNISGALQGSMVALVTPFDAEGRLCAATLRNLVQMHLAAGTSAIVAAGTTGEGCALSESEFCQLIEVVAEEVNGRVPVVAGAGAAHTQGCLRWIELADGRGADFMLCVTPYYLKTTQAGLKAHYEVLADASTAPIILYNVPGRTGSDLQPETTGELSHHENIVAIKEAVSGPDRVRNILRCSRDDMVVVSGDDATCMLAAQAGAKGVISVTANVAPQAMQKMFALWQSGQEEQAFGMQGQLMALHELLMTEPNPIPAKYMLSRMGCIENILRLPLISASAPLRAKIDDAVQRYGNLLWNKHCEEDNESC